jgi:hypothetical protein
VTGPPEPAWPEDARALAALLDGLRERALLLVKQRAADDPDPADPWRGLRQTPDSVARLLTRPPSRDPAPAAAARAPRLDWLTRESGLSALDAEILLIAIAPDLDRGFEACYGYLNDDVTLRRATAGLALELAGHSALDPSARGRFAATAPLSAGNLILIDGTDRPLLSRSLRVPDRVVAFLTGDDSLDDALAGIVTVAGPTASGGSPASAPDGSAGELARLLSSGSAALHLRERPAGAGDGLAVAALHAAGRPALLLDISAATLDRAVSLAPLLAREARLRGAGLVITVADGLDPGPLCDLPVPVLLLGDVQPGPRGPVAVDIGPGGQLVAAGPPRGGRRAGAAPMAGPGVRRVVPGVGWEGLVLPEEPAAALRELAGRVRDRGRVLGEWGLRPGGGRGHGVTALFAGESGTGKTLAAEVVARELGLELYVAELPALVDKYVGETEKNLERLFGLAERAGAVLLFDEADALFGKRSSARDARDRYANMESSYLLQRLESFEGVAVLTSNLRGNIDEAFTRRFDLVVHFPFPGAGLRARLWAGCLAGGVPVAGGIDLGEVAAGFELSGGSIRAAATTAAYLAAAAGRPVTQADLLTGARREYRKQGRLL